MTFACLLLYLCSRTLRTDTQRTSHVLFRSLSTLYKVCFCLVVFGLETVYRKVETTYLFFFQNSCSGVCLPIYVSCFRLLLPQPPTVCLSVVLELFYYPCVSHFPYLLLLSIGVDDVVVERFHVVAKWLICLIDYSTNWKLDICLGLVCHILQCTHTLIPITITTSSVFLVSSSPISFFPLQSPFSLSSLPFPFRGEGKKFLIKEALFCIRENLLENLLEI